LVTLASAGAEADLMLWNVETGKRVEHQPVGVAGQMRVGVQEQQYVALRYTGAGVHLLGAPACGHDDAVGERAGEGERVIATAAVGDNHLDAAGAKRRQRRERGFDLRGLVQHRHDDGEFHHSAASFNAPPQLEPCPAVQP